jgi:rod shape-determining protein MreD
MWRDYWMEWVLAAVLIAINEWLEWQVAGLTGAPVPFNRVVPPLVITIFLFPIIAWIVSRLDQWRLGR